MDIRPLSDGESRWTFWYQTEWLDILRGSCNWYTLTLIELQIENEVCLGNINYSVGLLGFRAGGSYTYNLEIMKEMNSEVDEWLEKNGLDKEQDTNKKD